MRRLHLHRFCLPLLAASLLLTGVAADAQTYRWIDANGRTVLSDTPPPGRPPPISRSRCTPPKTATRNARAPAICSKRAAFPSAKSGSKAKPTRLPSLP